MYKIMDSKLSKRKWLLHLVFCFLYVGNELEFTITPAYIEKGATFTVSCHGLPTTVDSVFYEISLPRQGSGSYCSSDCYFEKGDVCWGNLSTVGNCYCDENITEKGANCPEISHNVTYIVLQAEEKMFGTWACMLGEIEPAIYFKLHEYIAASITNLPKTRNVRLYSQLSFTCKATGNPTPQFSWTKDGSVISSDAMLFIDNINKTHKGEYVCEVHNPVASYYESHKKPDSNILEVFVIYPPETEIGPCSDGHVAQKNKNVTLLCSVTDAYPATSSYSWQRNGKVIDHEYQNTYVINNIKPEDNGIYSCKGHNGVRGEEATELSLHVHYSPENSWINDTEGTLEIHEGTKLYLQCEAEANPPATYHWSGKTTHEGDILVINNIAYTDSGIYTCTASNSFTPCAGSEISESDTVSTQLLVLHAPKDSPEVAPDNIIVAVNTPFTVSCNLNTLISQGLPYTTWLIWTGGDDIQPAQNITFANSNGDVKNVEWLFNSASVKDSSNYTCQAGNWIGTSDASSHQRIFVEANATVENYTNNTNYPKYNGGSPDLLNITCVVSASNIDDIYFTLNGNDIKDGKNFTISDPVPVDGDYSFGLEEAQKVELQWRAGEKSLTCDNVTIYDGAYVCHGSATTAGEPGVAESSAINIETYYAALWNSANNWTVAEFGAADFELNCDICMNPEATRFQWYYNESVIQEETSQTYLIEYVDETHFGIYHCEVENSAGTERFPVHLLESSRAGNPDEFNILSNTTSSSLTLTWRIGRNGNWPPINHTVEIQIHTTEGRCNTSAGYTQWVTTVDDGLEGTEIMMILEPLNHSSSYDIQLQAVNQRTGGEAGSDYRYLCNAQTTASPKISNWNINLDSEQLTISWLYELQRRLNDQYVGLAFTYEEHGKDESRYPADGSIDASKGEVVIPGPFNTDAGLTVSALVYEGNNQVGVMVKEGTLPPKSANAGAIVGGVIGLLVLAALVVVIILGVLNRREIQDKYSNWRHQSEPLTSQQGRGVNEYEFETEPETFDNIGFDPYEQADLSDNNHANKPEAASGELDQEQDAVPDPSHLYAAVVKPKKSKPDKQKDPAPDPAELYATVVKKKKNKPVKKGTQETDVDAEEDQGFNLVVETKVTLNTNQTNAGGKPKVPQRKPKMKGKNKDRPTPDEPNDPLYIKLEFPNYKPPKRGRKPEIRGEEDRTIYAVVDFDRTAGYRPQDYPPPYEPPAGEEDVMGALPPQRSNPDGECDV